MKQLVISIVITIFLLGGWLLFFIYAENTIDDYTQYIKYSLLPTIESDSWDIGMSKMSFLENQWHDFRKIALFFLDTETLNEIDYSIARASKYIKSEDISNSSGELNAIIEQLTFLSQNEKLNLNNIF